MAISDLIDPYSILLFVTHFLVRIITFTFVHIQIIWRTIQGVMQSGDEFFEIKALVPKLQKVPRHVAYCIDADQISIGKSSNIKAVAKLVSWTWAAGIPVISIYDTHEQMKENPAELEICIEKAIVKLRDERRLPTVEVKIHDVFKNTDGIQGIEQLNTRNKLHIILFGPPDGKTGIIEVAKNLFRKKTQDNLIGNNNEIPSLDSDLKQEKITETRINASLPVALEPDLLIICGSTLSTFGFLPWHIRLTEIHWLPTFPAFSVEDFSSLLRKYSACHQKVGK